MKTLHRRRLALWGTILFALTALLLFVYRRNSAPQTMKVLAEESASLRTGQPLLGGGREPGARSGSGIPPRKEPRPPEESQRPTSEEMDRWLKEDPKVRLIIHTIDKVIPEGSYYRLAWVSEGALGVQPTWVEGEQVRWDGMFLNNLEGLVGLASDKSGLLHPGFLEDSPLGADMVTPLRLRESMNALSRGDPAPYDSLSLHPNLDHSCTNSVVTSPGMEATLVADRAINGSLIGAHVTVKAERVAGGTALRGQAILRVLMAPPQVTGP